MTCPAPYYICHAVFALVIGAVLWWPLGLVAGLAAGAFFYVGREVAQWESGLPFDWMGLLAPVASCAGALLLWVLFH